jgi:hypothetical protein
MNFLKIANRLNEKLNTTAFFMKNFKYILVLLPFLALYSNLLAMEQAQHECCFNDLPIEIKTIAFSFLPNVCKTQQEASNALQALSLTNNECHTITHQLEFIRSFVKNSLEKFNSTELKLLLITGKSHYLYFAEMLKTIIQCAFIQHNKRCRVPNSIFIERLKESYKIINELAQKKDWQTVCQEIILEYQTLMDAPTSQARSCICPNNCSIPFAAYTTTSIQLLSLTANTNATIEGVFKRLTLSEKLLQIQSILTNDFNDTFNNDPFYTTIEKESLNVSNESAVFFIFLQKADSFYRSLT